MSESEISKFLRWMFIIYILLWLVTLISTVKIIKILYVVVNYIFCYYTLHKNRIRRKGGDVDVKL